MDILNFQCPHQDSNLATRIRNPDGFQKSNFLCPFFIVEAVVNPSGSEFFVDAFGLLQKMLAQLRAGKRHRVLGGLYGQKNFAHDDFDETVLRYAWFRHGVFEFVHENI